MSIYADPNLTEYAMDNMLAQRNADLQKRAVWTDEDFVKYAMATYNAMYATGAFSSEWTAPDVFSTGSNPIQRYGLLTLATVWGDQESFGSFDEWPIVWNDPP